MQGREGAGMQLEQRLGVRTLSLWAGIGWRGYVVGEAVGLGWQGVGCVGWGKGLMGQPLAVAGRREGRDTYWRAALLQYLTRRAGRPHNGHGKCCSHCRPGSHCWHSRQRAHWATVLLLLLLRIFRFPALLLLRRLVRMLNRQLLQLMAQPAGP